MACAMAALLLHGCGRDQPVPAADVRTLMLEQVQPVAQTYWDSVQYVSDSSGSHEIFPRNDAEWQRVETAAKRLGALGEALKTPAYANGRNADWQDFAQGLIDVSKLAAQAAAEKNRDRIFEVGGTIYNVCAACHQTYLPKTATPPPPPSGANAATAR
ncbi:hypothetical protein Q4610_10830 [Sphingobium sp. HBC34]|uniref:Cytochrome c n=1 Tax=Sphingobium cyanobacteriorum TaxID=3063954 RepID=A0ABT8ZMV6_9SPHN|nr:hypothetical protein [Sphingobium sp. HBC34]MDO7835536.1 hypothetical protein [Sphingobium sp. HBC34]